MSTNVLTWADVCAIPWLKDIPAKIETNRHHKILMSPASSWHSSFQGDLGNLLHQHLPAGKVLVECPIDTSDGTRAADVAWMSRERWLPHRRTLSLPVAPEICVEVLSPSNTRQEMLEKMALYYERGALEVWLCDEDGRMEFFVKDQSMSVPSSVLCPSFPQQLSVD